MKIPDFSVIICTVDNFSGLKECIASILLNSLLPKEIIVVHSGDSTEVSKYIESISRESSNRRISFQYISSPKSLVLQRNTGIDHASGDVVFFLDDDAYPKAYFFKVIMDFYAVHWEENLGGVQGTIESHKKMSNNSFLLLRKIFFLTHLNGTGFMQKSGYPSFLSYSPISQKVEIFNGCQMSFKRDILEKEKFDTYFKENWFGDDYELSYRISRRYLLYQLPDAAIEHVGSSESTEGLKRMWKMQIPNHKYIFQKFFSAKKQYFIFYYVSFAGDMFAVLSQTVRYRSLDPLIGWIQGMKALSTDSWHV
jgi:GT2 family glycosyltransferase